MIESDLEARTAEAETENEMNKVLVVAVLPCMLLACRAEAVMMQSQSLVVDFTKPDEIAKKATWNDPQMLHATPKGLSFNWDAEPLRRDHTPEHERGKLTKDVSVQTEPVAVGWSWRPVYAVTVHAEVVPPGQYQFNGGTTVYPSGEVFARFSPDLKHWSSWQALERDQPVDRTHPKQTYHGTLRVPDSERQHYTDLLSEYMRKPEVPWASDEEAAVKWIVGREPDFFAKQIPFIGYVQFKFEVGLKGDQAIEQLKFDLDYGAGGVHSVPKDSNVYKERDVPWRFRAD